MTRRIFSFDEPDRFVAGTVGEPGARTFFLQARDGGRIVSVVLEKAQVAVMAERLTALLDELARHGLEVPIRRRARRTRARSTSRSRRRSGPGTLSLTWDGEQERIIVEAREITEADEAGESTRPDRYGRRRGRAGHDPGHPAAGAARGSSPTGRPMSSGAGRPPCPLCGLPLDPMGHICPRKNGYMN